MLKGNSSIYAEDIKGAYPPVQTGTSAYAAGAAAAMGAMTGAAMGSGYGHYKVCQ